MSQKPAVWPYNKKNEDENKVKSSEYKDYENMKIGDKKEKE